MSSTPTFLTLAATAIWSNATSLVHWLFNAVPPCLACANRCSCPGLNVPYPLRAIGVFFTTELRALFSTIQSQFDCNTDGHYGQPPSSSRHPNLSSPPDSFTVQRLSSCTKGWFHNYGPPAERCDAWGSFSRAAFMHAYSAMMTLMTFLVLPLLMLASGFLCHSLRRLHFRFMALRLRQCACAVIITRVSQICCCCADEDALRAKDSLQSFSARVDLWFLKFLHFVVNGFTTSGCRPSFWTRPTFRILDKIEHNHALEGQETRTCIRDTEHTSVLTTKDEDESLVYPSTSDESLSWNAPTISTILFDSIRSTTTISFSLSLLSSASVLFPHYLRQINLSSLRRHEPSIFSKNGCARGGGVSSSLGSLDSSGAPQRGTTRRDSSCQRNSGSVNIGVDSPLDCLVEPVEVNTDIPVTITHIHTPVSGEHQSSTELHPTTHNQPLLPSSTTHERITDLYQLPEVPIISPLSTQTLFLSSSSDFSDPFTFYSFAALPSTPSITAHSPEAVGEEQERGKATRCWERTLVNDDDTSEFLHYPLPPTNPNPLASFHSNDEFMSHLMLDGVSPVGQGSFGTVWKAMGAEGRQYAVKIVKRVRGFDRVLANEIAAMWSVSASRWAVQLDYWQASDEAVLLAMRYCTGGSLTKLWESVGYRMDSRVAVFYAAELILAIHDLHTCGIMHRDIKLDNIVLDNGHIRIADFGLALSFDHGAVSKAVYPLFWSLADIGGDAFPPLFAAPHNPHIVYGACGTPGYGPPEVWDEGGYSFGVDYFAMACTLHAMLTGDLPYRWIEREDDYDLGELRIDPRRSLTEVERDFLTQVLAWKPSDRLSVRRMKKHPIFNHIDWHALSQGHLEPPIPVLNLSNAPLLAS